MLKRKVKKKQQYMNKGKKKEKLGLRRKRVRCLSKRPQRSGRQTAGGLVRAHAAF